MTTLYLDHATACLRIRWDSETEADFPFLWLRENCPTAFHPQTQERTFDLLSVPLDIAPLTAELDNDTLILHWEGDGHVSQFPLGWLKQHRPGQPLADPAAISPQLWRSELQPTVLPTAEAQSLLADDGALLAWLQAASATGLALVEGLRPDDGAGMEIAERIGFLRETNFGKTFEVVSKPDPNNLAYTAHRLPLHTDLPNQELPPGFQFLHCIANEARGGGSLFCDGFAIAEDLRRADPAAFALLVNTEIPLRFHDRDCDLRRRDTVIRLHGDGRLAEIRFNAHIAGVFDLPAATLSAYYPAYRRYMAATRSDDYLVALKLGAGQMVVFDNRRILHGRDAFDPATGFRRLKGCYVDRGEWDSRIRVLAR